MFKNHLKTAWRSLGHGGIFSVINISGLAIGMAGATLILLWLNNEISFDKFHRNKDRLYQAYGLTAADHDAIDQTEEPLGPALQKEYPEVEATARVLDYSNFLLTADEKHFMGLQGSFADPSFLKLFNFPLAEGDPRDQLENLYSIVITRKLAIKLFGTENAVNKIIRIDSSGNFKVTAVLKDLPPNTRFHFEFLLPWAYFKKLGWGDNTWMRNWITTFVLLKPHTDLTAFNNKIKDIARIHANRNDIWTHFLYPLAKWHLYSRLENGKPVGGRIETVRLFGFIAAFILLIACINFMNLGTARSEKRAKEVGIRKVAGAGRRLLIGQFLTEAVLTSAIAGVLAFLLVQLTLPAFNRLINVQLPLPYTSFLFWICALGFILFTGLLAGSYPAFYLSSFNPAAVLKGKFKNGHLWISPRKVLVVVQFGFATIMIIATLVVSDQIRHVQDRGTGYSQNNLVYVNFSGKTSENYPLIRRELIHSHVAVAVTETMAPITERGANTWGFRWQGKGPNTDPTIALFSEDAGLVKTAGLQLIKGRDIDIYKYPSDSFALLLNQTAVQTMGLKSPVGAILTVPDDKTAWHVVGVVKDFIVNSPFENIPPLVIEGPATWFNGMHIKFNPSRSTAENLAKTAGIFKKYNSDYPFDYQFIDEKYAAEFNNEQRAKALAGLFAALAIFISSLGLFGLATYMAESRTKEIGIRKVLGASVFTLTRLLTFDFIKLVILSTIIASPIAWDAMNRWLQGYTYRITLGWGIFLVAGSSAILISLTTVSYQAIKAAVTKPAKSLRTE
jgi:putative ABC transport system permease protein